MVFQQIAALTFNLSLYPIAALTFHLSLAVLGPEQPLSPKIELAPAAFSQIPVSAASNGGEFLALWKTFERFDRPPRFHLGRIGADGKPPVAFSRSFPASGSINPSFESARTSARSIARCRCFRGVRPCGTESR
jgi:hypothetical protein